MNRKIISWAMVFTILAWVGGGILVILGLWKDEPPLKNPRKIEQIETGLSKGAIRITQISADQPLTADFKRELYPQKITDDEWKELEQTINKLVATANWGLGAPFNYNVVEDTGEIEVSAFNANEFKYFNPFKEPVEKTFPLNIKYSGNIAQSRNGWRIIGANFSLFLKPDAVQDELEVNLDGSIKNDLPPVAKSFSIRSSRNKTLRLSEMPSVKIEDGKSTGLTLGAEVVGENKKSLVKKRFNHGESFSWDRLSFVVQKSSEIAASTPAATPDKKEDLSGDKQDDLVLTKRINGRQTRVNLFGQSTMNLIGGQIAGQSRLLEGAVDVERVSEIRLTLDPDLQNQTYRLVKSALEEIDGKAGLGFRRRGSAAILDADTGGILALIGFPSADPNRIDQRRVLFDRNRALQNPAFEKHMPGSAVKVLTVALGFLLYNSAQADLLPTSDNQKAVRQTFQDAYGKPLTAELVGHKADLTAAAHEEFKQVGGVANLQPDCPLILMEAFNVLPSLKNQLGEDNNLREEIIRGTYKGYFDNERLKEVFPVFSSFPLKDVDSMNRLRNYALGGEAARFTTLRLAAILGTAGNGNKYSPYLVESIRERSGKLIKEDQNGVIPLKLSTQNGNSHIPKMVSEMKQYLGKVLVPGGTGYFYPNEGDKKLFLGEDNPATLLNEGELRKNDYGKSGTADNDGKNSKPDSVFVLSHGKYLIAVWLEQSDFENANPALGSWRDNPAHKTVYRIVQLIENLDYQAPK